MKAVTSDLGRPKLAARADSGWTCRYVDFSALVSWSPKMSSQLLLLGWYLQALGPVQGAGAQTTYGLQLPLWSIGVPHSQGRRLWLPRMNSKRVRGKWRQQLTPRLRITCFQWTMSAHVSHQHHLICRCTSSCWNELSTCHSLQVGRQNLNTVV